MAEVVANTDMYDRQYSRSVCATASCREGTREQLCRINDNMMWPLLRRGRSKVSSKNYAFLELPAQPGTVYFDVVPKITKHILAAVYSHCID